MDISLEAAVRLPKGAFQEWYHFPNDIKVKVQMELFWTVL